MLSSYPDAIVIQMCHVCVQFQYKLFVGLICNTYIYIHIYIIFNGTMETTGNLYICFLECLHVDLC